MFMYYKNNKILFNNILIINSNPKDNYLLNLKKING